MDIPHHLECNTHLQDRILWFDGSSTVDPSNIDKYIGKQHIFVSEITEEIAKYNKIVPTSKKLQQKESVNIHDIEWVLPPEFASFDIEHLMIELFDNHMNSNLKYNYQVYEHRLVEELAAYKRLKLYDLLRTMHYIVQQFKTHDVVWGIGRGSSVASYVLYLLQVHSIDPVEYEIDFSEFIGA